eukprot:2876516-Heterocapsa_arctica.AAC.1
MHIIDGDEFSLETNNASDFSTVTKANGETQTNHYDLMHPMILPTCKARTYTRRSDIQQIEPQKHEDINITYRHRKTRIGEEQTKQAHYQNSEKLGPEEEGSRMRDCTARQRHDEKNQKHGILYTEEKEYGTLITSTNLSGSQFHFEFMLEH